MEDHESVGSLTSFIADPEVENFWTETKMEWTKEATEAKQQLGPSTPLREGSINVVQ